MKALAPTHVCKAQVFYPMTHDIKTPERHDASVQSRCGRRGTGEGCGETGGSMVRRPPPYETSVSLGASASACDNTSIGLRRMKEYRIDPPAATRMCPSPTPHYILPSAATNIACKQHLRASMRRSSQKLLDKCAGVVTPFQRRAREARKWAFDKTNLR